MFAEKFKIINNEKGIYAMLYSCSQPLQLH